MRVDTVALPGGRTSKREVVEHPGSVAVVPVDAGGNVVLVRQYRKSVEQWLVEIPAGGMDEGEAPALAASRELLEETGYKAGAMELLGMFYTSPGFCTEAMYAYLATDLKPGDANPEEDEAIETVRMPLRDLVDKIHRGELHDGKTIASVLLAAHRLNFS